MKRTREEVLEILATEVAMHHDCIEEREDAADRAKALEKQVEELVGQRDALLEAAQAVVGEAGRVALEDEVENACDRLHALARKQEEGQAAPKGGGKTDKGV